MQAQAEQLGGDAEMASTTEPSDKTTEVQSYAQWKKDETMLLQYIVLNVIYQKDISVDEFTDQDWQTVASLVPGRTMGQCQKRWLFIQKIEGKKYAWNAQETEMLKKIAEEITMAGQSSTQGTMTQPKEWKRIAEEFNRMMGPGSKRNPRQCRERWINVIDPTVRRDKWTLVEEIQILKLWLELGSKWHDISLQVEGRTEIQVKNRFNCLVRKDSQKAQAGQALSEYVSALIAKMEERLEI